MPREEIGAKNSLILAT